MRPGAGQGAPAPTQSQIPLLDLVPGAAQAPSAAPALVGGGSGTLADGAGTPLDGSGTLTDGAGKAAEGPGKMAGGARGSELGRAYGMLPPPPVVTSVESLIRSYSGSGSGSGTNSPPGAGGVGLVIRGASEQTLGSGSPPAARRSVDVSSPAHSPARQASLSGSPGSLGGARRSLVPHWLEAGGGAGGGGDGRRPSKNLDMAGQDLLARAVGKALERTNNYELGVGLPVYELVKSNQRLKAQLNAYKALLLLVFTISFLALMIKVRNTALAGEQTLALMELFLNEEFHYIAEPPGLFGGEAPFFKKKYADVQSEAEWWQWASGPLMQGLFGGGSAPASGSPGPLYGFPRPTAFGQLYLLGGSNGGVLMRSSRVPPVGCGIAGLSASQVCYPEWEEGEQDTAPFGNLSAFALAEPLSSARSQQLAAKAFNWSQAPYNDFEGTGLGHLGFLDYNQYGYGGYMVDLPANNAGNATVQALLNMLLGGWTDVQTRLISVEFNVFNPDTRIVTACRLFTEVSQTGWVRPSYRFYHIKALAWSKLPGIYWFAFIVFIALLLLFTLAWMRGVLLARRTCSHLSRFNTFFDLALIVLFWVVVARVTQLSNRSSVVSPSALEKTLASQTFTPGIYQTGRAMHDMDALCAVNLVLCAVKFVGFLPFKTTRVLWNTIAAALKDIIVLGLVVFLFWGAFAVGSHTTFGSLGFEDFARVDRTFGTLMVLMFSGALDFNAMREVSFLSAPVFYAIYMIFMWGVMLNLFVAIIVNTYERYSVSQNNFDKWLADNRGAQVGSIVLLHPQVVWSALKRGWLRLRLACVGRRAKECLEIGAKVPPSSFIRRAIPTSLGSMRTTITNSSRNGGSNTHGKARRASAGSSEDEDEPGYVAPAAAQSLSEAMRLVMEQAPGTDRAQVAQDLVLPFRTYFFLCVRQVLWLKAVRKTRQVLQEYSDGSELEGTFVGRWRKEVDFATGDLSRDISLWDSIKHYLRACFKGGGSAVSSKGEAAEERRVSMLMRMAGIGGPDPQQQNQQQQNQQQGRESELAAGGISLVAINSRVGSPESATSMRTQQGTQGAKPPNAVSPALRRERQQIRHALLLQEQLKFERELVELKDGIHQVLRDTASLFRRHRLSFNGIVLATWTLMKDDERLQELHYDQLRELLSPGCLELRRPCALCLEDDISSRAQTLLYNYARLCKRNEVRNGKQQRFPRFHRKPLQRPAPPRQAPPPDDVEQGGAQLAGGALLSSNQAKPGVQQERQRQRQRQQPVPVPPSDNPPPPPNNPPPPQQAQHRYSFIAYKRG
jgi:hypothetical protein